MTHTREISTARALRRRETDIEYRLWQTLRKRPFGLKFRRQHPVGSYVVDFACIEARLLVEIDGYWHTVRKPKDQERTRFLQGRGFAVLRFDIESETANVEAIAEGIAHEARQRVSR